LRREFSGSVSNLWAFYQVSWEEKYGDCAKRSLDFFLSAQNENGSFPRDIFTDGPRGDTLRTDGPESLSGGGSEQYTLYDGYRLTQEPRIKQAGIAFADWVYQWYRNSAHYGVLLDMQVAEASHTMMNLGLPTFWLVQAFLWTGQPHYLEPLQDLVRNFPNLAREWASMRGRTCFQEAGLAWQALSSALAALAKAQEKEDS
jgi:hypothetical protein